MEMKNKVFSIYSQQSQKENTAVIYSSWLEKKRPVHTARDNLSGGGSVPTYSSLLAEDCGDIFGPTHVAGGMFDDAGTKCFFSRQNNVCVTFFRTIILPCSNEYCKPSGSLIAAQRCSAP